MIEWKDGKSTMFTLAARLILGMALLGIWLSASAEPSYACECLPRKSPSEALAGADIVFRGRAMSIHVDEGKDGFVRTTTEFDVSVVWKGPLNRAIAITTGGSNCAFGFSEGEEYIVYSNSGSAGICGRTHNLAPGFYNVDYNDLEELGPGQAPTADATTPAPTPAAELPATSGGCSRASSSGADVWWAALAVGRRGWAGADCALGGEMAIGARRHCQDQDLWDWRALQDFILQTCACPAKTRGLGILKIL